MFEIVVEEQFKKDYKQVSREHTQIVPELKAATEHQKAKEKLRSRLILAAEETKQGLTIPYKEFRKSFE